MGVSKLGTGSKKRIGELLIEAELITHSQLEEALAEVQDKGKKTVESLIGLGYLEQADFLNFLANRQGIASVDLPCYSISADVLELVPAAFAIEHEIIPLDKMGQHLTVAMACPLDSKTIAELEAMIGFSLNPLLVSIRDIKLALEHYYALEYKKQRAEVEDADAATIAKPPPPKNPVESLLTLGNIIGLIRQVDQLPALPATLIRIREILEMPDYSVAQVAEVLESDPVLSAKVLSLANSSAYGFLHYVDSVDLAVSLLGLHEIYNVVLAASVFENFKSSKRFDYTTFWQRSIRSGAVARILAGEVDKEHSKGIVTGVLLHDLGRVVMAEVMPEAYAKLDQTLADKMLAAEETRQFGIAHPEVGFILASSWQLPDDIVQPMRFHQRIAFADMHKERVAMVSLASQLVDAREALRNGDVEEVLEEANEALEMLGLSQETLRSLLGDILTAIEDA